MNTYSCVPPVHTRTQQFGFTPRIDIEMGPIFVATFDVLLMVLLAVLLYRIARLAQVLSGDQLNAAVKLVKARRSARRNASHLRLVKLDDLTAEQRAMIERVRDEYLRENGELDELWEPFLLRFLVHCEWNEADTIEKLRSTIVWRTDCAAAIRRRVAEGWKVAEHEGVRRLFRTLGLVPMHRRSLQGDVLTIADIGSLDPDTWLQRLSDDEFTDAVVHLLETLSYHADALSAKERTLVRQALVLDYEELRWAHLSPSVLRRLRAPLALVDAHYPELIGSATCVHASPLFVHLWGALAPCLSVGLRGRVSIQGREQTHATLLRTVTPSHLPTSYGGTCDVMPSDVRSALGLDKVASELPIQWIRHGKLAGYLGGDVQHVLCNTSD